MDPDAVLGALSLVGVVVTLFFAVGRRPANLRLDEAPPVGSDAFQRAVAGTAGAPARTMLHTKAVVVDGLWTVVGSANMDIRSDELNQENVMGILDPAFAGRMEATFLRDLGQAREIRLAEWQRRGELQRFMEWTASRFAEQY